MSSEFDFVTLQYTFRFRNYIQAPVPIVHVSTPEQSLMPPQSLDSSDSTLMGSQEGVTERGLQDKGSIWVGHPPEGTTLAFETEIFIPSYHYDDAGLEILVSDGDWRYVKERQTLYYRHKEMEPGAVHSIRIKAISGPTTALTRTRSKQSLGATDSHLEVESGGAVLRRRAPSPIMKISGSAEQKGGANKVEGPSGCICGIM